MAVARLSLMDWAAVALAGLDEPVARMVREMVAEEAGAGQATLLGLDRKIPARAAHLPMARCPMPLITTTRISPMSATPAWRFPPQRSRIAERQDARVWPFSKRRSWAWKLPAAGHWLGTGHYNHGFHQTATAGAFGAAVAAGRLLGLSQERMEHTLGIISTRASGLKSQFGTMGKPFNAGIAASNGVEAHYWPRAASSRGPMALNACRASPRRMRVNAATLSLARGLGTDFWFETVQHKFHACCHGTHATLEALNALRQRPISALAA